MSEPTAAPTRALPFEYRSRPIPEELELCARCLQGLVFRRGADGVSGPYCPKCGAEAPGIVFVRKTAERHADA